MSRLVGFALLSSDRVRRPGGFEAALSLALDKLHHRAAHEGMELVERPRVTVERQVFQEWSPVLRRAVWRRTVTLRAEALARPKKPLDT